MVFFEYTFLMNTEYEPKPYSVPALIQPLATFFANTKVRARAFLKLDQADVRYAQKHNFIGGHEADIAVAQLSDPRRFEKRSKI